MKSCSDIKGHEWLKKIYMPNSEPSPWSETHPIHLDTQKCHLILFSYITMAQGWLLLETLQCSERILPYNIIMLLQGHLLYYYFLNSDAEPIKKGVKSWAAQVDEFSHTSKPNSKPASLKSKPASTKSHAASSSTRISSKSTLTETVVIKAEQKGRRELKADPSVSDDDALVAASRTRMRRKAKSVMLL